MYTNWNDACTAQTCKERKRLRDIINQLDDGLDGDGDDDSDSEWDL